MPILESGFAFSSPLMVKVHQKLVGPTLTADAIRQQLEEQFQLPAIQTRLRPGMRVAVAVGSRGIDQLSRIVRQTVSALKERGAEPVIVPAMGSHGGGTAAGQEAVLATYGITPENMGAPIDARMDTIELGRVQDVPIYFSRVAYEADLIVPVCRIKPHTDFKAPIESGICKMLVIGLGKHKGASSIHRAGMPRFGSLIPEAADFILHQAPVGFAVAIVENGHDQVGMVQVVPQSRILEEEPKLLAIAKDLLPTLGIDTIDVLVVNRIGKNISGEGMDPNVTGRSPTAVSFPHTPTIGRVVVLGLTEETHGNASGIGLADLIPQRCYAQIDRTVTYTNVITAGLFDSGKMPIVLDTDQEVMAVALKAATLVDPEQARVVRIEDTLHLEEFWVSDVIAEELRVQDRFEITHETRRFTFDAEGNVLW